MSRMLINRTNSKSLLRLFDICFKQGVKDANDTGDVYFVQEFVDRHKDNGDYGLVSDDENFDWRRWRFTLELWCREYRMGRFGYTLFSSAPMRRSSHSFIFAIIPIARDFYLAGVKEWLEYPNPAKIELFMSTPKIHWKKMPSHMVKMTKPDIIAMVQQFVYDRQRLKLEGDLTENQYDDFASYLWDITRT